METEKKEFLEKISKLENLLKEAKTNASNMASNDTAGNLLKEAKTSKMASNDTASIQRTSLDHHW